MISICKTADRFGVHLQYALGPAYNGFGYYEHPAIMNNFFL